jgi:hypothetical protein
MIDYVNHLARMHLLTAAGTSDANPYYDIKWKLYPNLAMDLSVPFLGRFMSVEAAAKLFFLVSQVLVFTGAVAIEWRVKGRNELSGFVALLVLFSVPFLWGLTNFQFGMGVALWAVAFWIALEERGWGARLAVHSGFTVLLFLSHFFALGTYGATIFLYEMSRLFSRQFDVKQAMRMIALMAAPTIALLCVMIYSGGGIGGKTTDWWFFLKLIWPFRFFSGYSLSLAASSAAALLFLLFFLIHSRSLAVRNPGKWIGIGFLILYLALPRRLFDSAYVDVRMITAAGLILPAFVTYTSSKRRERTGSAALVVAIVLANTFNVASVWLSYQPEYAAMKKSFALIQPASKVLVGRSADASSFDLTEQPVYYAPTLATYYAKAFVPSLYTIAGMQPIAKAAQFQRLEIADSLDYLPPPLSVLKAIAAGEPAPDAPSYVHHWTTDYDYVYLVGPRIPNPMPEILTEISAGERFALYRLRS